MKAPHTIYVRLTPKASRNHIEDTQNENGSPLYKIYVTAVPENGKANSAAIKLLAKHLGVSKSRLTLIRGETSRDKIFSLTSS